MKYKLGWCNGSRRRCFRLQQCVWHEWVNVLARKKMCATFDPRRFDPQRETQSDRVGRGKGTTQHKPKLAANAGSVNGFWPETGVRNGEGGQAAFGGLAAPRSGTKTATRCLRGNRISYETIVGTQHANTLAAFARSEMRRPRQQRVRILDGHLQQQK